MRNTRILIVGLEEHYRKSSAEYFQSNGLDTEIVSNCDTAVIAVANQKADVVLLDLDSQILSGIEILRRLRHLRSQMELPIIMMTSNLDCTEVICALDSGASDFLTKPIILPLAVARIRFHLARVQSAAALRKSEERYALAARSTNDGLFDWDFKSNEIYYSPRWKEMLGYGETDLTFSPNEWSTRLEDPDLENLTRRLRSHIAGHTKALECVYRIMHRDGNLRWMNCRGVAIWDNSGEAVRLIGSQSDVTESLTRDALTGLRNRTLFDSYLQSALRQYKQDSSRGFATLFLDVDKFKEINDRLGHCVGDQLLCEIARRLRTSVRSFDTSAPSGNDIVVRYGGDEFAILLYKLNTIEAATKACERLAGAMRPVFQLAGLEIHCSASIGIVLAANRHITPDVLLHDADIAMYAAKSKGCGFWSVFEPEMVDRMRCDRNTE